MLALAWGPEQYPVPAPGFPIETLPWDEPYAFPGLGGESLS